MTMDWVVEYCESRPCEECPIFLFNLDSRSELGKKLGQIPCSCNLLFVDMFGHKCSIGHRVFRVIRSIDSYAWTEPNMLMYESLTNHNYQAKCVLVVDDECDDDSNILILALKDVKWEH